MLDSISIRADSLDTKLITAVLYHMKCNNSTEPKHHSMFVQMLMKLTLSNQGHRSVSPWKVSLMEDREASAAL